MRVAFAPGRVNLVGEHIDYHGLPVLPMALRRGVRVEFSPLADPVVILRNGDPRFDSRRFPLASDVSPGPPGDWGNYAMAAAVAVAKRYGATTGVEASVTSDLPAAAGLSSSSAVVVAVALALLDAQGVHPDPLELAEVLAEGERFVGTAGGGMDQAASLSGRRGHALRIRFEPLAVEPIPVPGEWAVAVAHSGVAVEKSGGAQAAYNHRRESSAGALKALARAAGRPGATVAELLEGGSPEALLERAGELPEPGGPWAVHAITEAARVDRAVAALRGGDLAAFGEVLVASHHSLRDVYRVSHPELDRLVEAALEAGAAGARLTGAGFGGCMLAVCRREDLPAVLDALRRTQPAGAVPAFHAESGEGARVEPVA